MSNITEICNDIKISFKLISIVRILFEYDFPAVCIPAFGRGSERSLNKIKAAGPAV